MDRCCRGLADRVVGSDGADTLAPSGDDLCVLAGGDADHVVVGGTGWLVATEGGPDVVYLREAGRVLLGEGNDALYGSDLDDVVHAGPGADGVSGAGGDDIVFGDEGDDVLRGGAGNDRLVGGPGRDEVYGDDGDDVIVVAALCDIEPREIIDGGAGTDTLITPVDVATLAAMGVTVRNIEHVILRESPRGGSCAVGTDGLVRCSCCDREGFSAESACESCEVGFMPVGPWGRGEPSEGDDPRDLECVPAFSCGRPACGGRGECVSSPEDGDFCRCDAGFEGDHCERCAPPFVADVTGACVLAPDCDATHCAGRGHCADRGAAGVACLCADGSEGCGRPPLRHLPESSLAAGHWMDIAPPQLPPGCEGDMQWEIVRGGGELTVTADRVQYFADFTPRNGVDVVVLRATPVLCPGAVMDMPVSVYKKGGISVRGDLDPALEPVDEAVIAHMQAAGIPGGVVTIGYRGKIVYRRAFGDARPHQPMMVNAQMRVASVSKFFTRAAIAQLEEAGQIADNRGDGLVNLLGLAFFGLDADNKPRRPFALDEYCRTADPEDVENPERFWTDEALAACNTHADQTFDARWNDITVNDLVFHRAGFNRSARLVDRTVAGEGLCPNTLTGDFSQNPAWVSRTLPVATTPPVADDIVQLHAGTCLYYAPLGSTSNAITTPSIPGLGEAPLSGTALYSNFGYMLLGAIIEEVTGDDYEHYVQNEVLAPLGINGPFVGRTLPEHRSPLEPVYRTSTDSHSENIFEGTCATPGCPDGAWEFPVNAYRPNGGNFALEFRGAQGGWVTDGCSLVQLMMHRRVSTGRKRANDSTSSGGSQTGGFDGTSALIWQPGESHEPPDPQPALALSAGFHIAAMFNKADTAEVVTGDLRHGIAAALATLGTSKLDLSPVTCACGDGVRGGGEQCDGTDFGGASCGSYGYAMGDLLCQQCSISTAGCSGGDPWLPPEADPELAGCEGSAGEVGCECEVINLADINKCIGDSPWACELSQPDGAYFDDRFCYGPDVVCGKTIGGNPICRQCGHGEGQEVLGCPCTEVSCASPQHRCWENWNGATGRCWAAAEPPQHICIEACDQISVGDNAEPAVCVGPAHGLVSTPHLAGQSAFQHAAYCATQGCGGIGVGECENQGSVCVASLGGSSCDVQCSNTANCHAQGYPEHYVCNNAMGRCVPLY